MTRSVTPPERTVLDLAAEYQLHNAEPCPLKHILLARPPEFADALRSAVDSLARKGFLERSGPSSHEDLHLTPTGLLACRWTGDAAAFAEKLLANLKRRLGAEGVGFKAFSWEELKGAGVVASDDEFCLAVTVITVLDLSGGNRSWTKGPPSPAGLWGVPDDIVEMRTLKEIGDLESRALDRRAARDGIIRTRAGSDEAVDAPDLSDYRDEEQPWYRPVPVFPPAHDESATDPADVLLVTANVEELTAVQRVLTTGLRHVIGQHVYYSGTLGAYHAAVFQCAPGSMSRDAAALSAAEAIRTWRPKAVIVVGIAFGRDRTKQKIADVLVSSQVISYEQQRVGTGDPVPRGPASEAGPVLLSRFRDAKRRWDFRRPDGLSSALRDGPLLSGEKLVDNPVFLARLREAFPSAIGGEMEAAGVYAAASRHEARIEWIVVKGICDWGDGTKTDGYQPLAAAAAVSLVQFVLSDSTALASLPSPASQASTARTEPRVPVETSTPGQSTRVGIAEDELSPIREMNEAAGRLVAFYKSATSALEKLDTDVRSFTQQVKSFRGAPQERAMALVAAQRVLARKMCAYADVVEPLMPGVEADWSAVKRATPNVSSLPAEVFSHPAGQTFVKGIRDTRRVAARTSSESADVRSAIAGIQSLDGQFTEAIKRLTTAAHWVSIEFDAGARILSDLLCSLPVSSTNDVGLVDLCGLLFRGWVEEISAVEWTCRLVEPLGDHSLEIPVLATRTQAISRQYVAASRPGLARQLVEPPTLRRAGDAVLASLLLCPPQERESAHAIGRDLDPDALGEPGDGLSPGGVADIPRQLQQTLSTRRGEYFLNREFGSEVAAYTAAFGYQLVADIIAVETARLAFVPYKGDGDQQKCALPFIRRVNGVEPPEARPQDDWIKIKMELDVDGVGEWTGDVPIFIPRELGESKPQ